MDANCESYRIPYIRLRNSHFHSPQILLNLNLSPDLPMNLIFVDLLLHQRLQRHDEVWFRSSPGQVDSTEFASAERTTDFEGGEGVLRGSGVEDGRRIEPRDRRGQARRYRDSESEV